jgi:hypothetical protein
MSGMNKSPGNKKGADEPHLSRGHPLVAGVRARYSINCSPGAFAVS